MRSGAWKNSEILLDQSKCEPCWGAGGCHYGIPNRPRVFHRQRPESYLCRCVCPRLWYATNTTEIVFLFVTPLCLKSSKRKKEVYVNIWPSPVRFPLTRRRKWLPFCTPQSKSPKTKTKMFKMQERQGWERENKSLILELSTKE